MVRRHVNEPPATHVKETRFPDGYVAYFDTVAWNRLLDHPDRQSLIAAMARADVRVIASVFVAAEIAQTRDLGRRSALGALVRQVHGDGPLLEHPVEMAIPMSRAILRGEDDFVVPARPETEHFLAFLKDPGDDELHQEVVDWVARQEGKFATVFEQLKPPSPGSRGPFLTQEVLSGDPVLETLMALPGVREEGLTLADMRTMHDAPHDSIWTALAAMMAYLLDQADRHAGRRWRGAFDLWQAVYLGLPINAFVTDDGALRTAAAAILAVLKERREVLTPSVLFTGLKAREPSLFTP